MNLLEALEIFSHPKDLEISIERRDEMTKYSFGIYRGPGHNFKPLITSIPFAETLEGVIEVIKEQLELAVSASTKRLNGDGPLTDVLKCITDQSNTLNADIIERILKDLRKKKVASTYKYK